MEADDVTIWKYAGDRIWVTTLNPEIAAKYDMHDMDEFFDLPE